MAEQVQEADCVLVIDGDVLVRHAIADYLRGCGYTVIEASSTDEAVTVLDDSALDVDAVLCDAEAPGSRNAFQFRSWAIDHLQNVHFALAGNIESAAQKAAELCEQGPNLARPYDPQSVVEYIRRLLGRAQSTDVGVA
jgi:CheY-like chemotaxis protein